MSDNTKKAFSVTNGFSFSFEEGEHIIEAWFSSVTGKEKVILDNTLVASQRNYSKDSTNKFSIDGVEYATNLNTENLFKGPYICTLYKDSRPYKRQKISFPNLNKVYTSWKFLFFIALGAAFGTAYKYWQWPSVSILIFIAAIFLVSFLMTEKDKANFIIESEEIS